VRTPESRTDPLREYRERVPPLLIEKPGLKVGEIADELGIPVEVAKVVVRPLLRGALETTGKRKGMRYYVKGGTPKPRASRSEGAARAGRRVP
jgi:hypothetical protein